MFGYHRYSSSKVSSFVTGAVIGGVVLGAAALLCSSKKGKQLRKKLKKQAANTVKWATKRIHR